MTREIAQRLIQEIPTTLRAAAREEKKALQHLEKLAQTNPQAAEYKVANCHFSKFNIIRLNEMKEQLKSQFVTDFYQRQPVGEIPVFKPGVDVKKIEIFG